MLTAAGGNELDRQPLEEVILAVADRSGRTIQRRWRR